MPISWDELRTRLAHRRGVTIDGDRIRMWPRPRHRAGQLGIAFSCLVLGLGALLTPSDTRMPVGVAVTSLALSLAGVAFVWLALRPSVALELGGEGLRVPGVFVPWSDIDLTEVGGTNKRTILRVAVDPESGTVARMSWLRRRTALAESSRYAVRGVRIPIADTAVLPLAQDEVRALATHPAIPGPHRADRRDAERPRWDVETGKYADQPLVRTQDTTLVVSDGDGERLRIDDYGVHGRMPRDTRSVSWPELWQLGLLSGPRPCLLLHLSADSHQPALSGREWRWLADDFPGVTLPVPLRELPFDAIGLTGLLFAHPKGEALWQRMTAPGK